MKGFWNDKNGFLLCATWKMIYKMRGESQCRNFRQTVDGGIHGEVGSNGTIDSVRGMEETSLLLYVAHP